MDLKKIIIMNFKKLIWVLLSVFLIIFSLPSENQIILFAFLGYMPFFLISKGEKNGFLYCGLIGLITGLYIYFGFTNFAWEIYIYCTFLLFIQFLGLGFFISRYGIITCVLFNIIFEYSRQYFLYGFSSNIGLSLYKFPIMLGFASVGGIYLISSFLLIINYLLYLYYKKHKLKYLIFILFLVTVNYLFFINNEIEYNSYKNISIIQSGVKLEHESTEKIYSQLAQKALKQNTNILVFPETTLNNYSINSLSFYKNIYIYDILKNDKIIISGIKFDVLDNSYNSLIYLDKDYEKRYDKVRLVGKIEDKYTKGKISPVINTKNFNFFSSICYESIFEKNFLKNNKKYNFSVIISSDIEYKSTFINYLHGAYAVFRAIETGKYVCRAAHGGPSYLIDGKGRIVKEIEAYKTGFIQGEIGISDNTTFYSRNYSQIIIFYYILFVISVIPSFFKRKKS